MARSSTTRKLTRKDNPQFCIVRYKGEEYGCLSRIGNTLSCIDGEGNQTYLDARNCTIPKLTPVWTNEQLDCLACEYGDTSIQQRRLYSVVVAGPVDYAIHDSY